MNYELVSVLRPGDANWLKQKARLNENEGTLITLAPDPFYLQKRETDCANMINLVDYVTKRTYHPEKHLFFSKVPTVTGSDIFLEEDGTVSVIANGETIGQVSLFPNTRRLVQSIVYFNSDGTRDFMEEYTFDGQLFSRLFYYENAVQQICFFNDQQRVVLRFYFYQGVINLVTVEDPQTQEITEQFDSITDFYKAQVAKIVTTADTVGISYLGMELDALQETQSDNRFYLEEKPVDDQGNMLGNLQLILTNQITSVKEVVIDEEWRDVIAKTGVDQKKIIWTNGN
ncbi:hypothetical protein [Furfurilactobacillus siliginis]|uniref:Accessory Sec system glycosyltransferase GtfB n=1 Tax=Furfurilactobacillus siliginis TaxID=348151 RepID=A0A0R2KXF8_9LACO|nr:hypothetical protein [Furfurilactobacillus siliginis]KRN94110.1 hypothetical protein IV55_GL000623 [Furfurilactobacillus siliginis]GEK29086.1 hypothetical protein LSI01_13970 [Furfurilactobacillus siliginis]